MNNVLQLQNISRTYTQGGRSLAVLDHLNLNVKQGEIVALVGPSGSGKTTLLQIAGLLDVPTSGEVVVNGVGASHAPDAMRTQMRGKHIGFVYQMHHLLPEFSAVENVMLPQMMRGVSAADAKHKSMGLLSELGLVDRANHRPAALSGGEQQRVAIARALANDPVLLLADEPTGNLDPVAAENVFVMFMRLVKQKNIGVLVATHNMELAARMDRIVQLDKK